MKNSYGAATTEEGFSGERFGNLDHFYVPLHWTESSMALHATLPPGTFVPTHLHTEQEEFFHVLEGEFEFELNGEKIIGGPGTHVTMPRNVPHGFGNRTDKLAKALVILSPSLGFYQYMKEMDGVSDPAEVAELGKKYGVLFP